jgi:hypothetical protein
MNNTNTSQSVADKNFDLVTVLRLLLGLPRDADEVAIVEAVCALLRDGAEEDAQDEAEREWLRNLSSGAIQAIRARGAALERAYLSQGLEVEKDRLGRITRVFRRGTKRTKGE